MKPKVSIVFGTSLFIALMLGITIVVVIVSNIYFHKTSTQNVLDAVYSSMAVHTSQLEQGLRTATAALDEIAYAFTMDYAGYLNGSELKRYLDSMQILGTLAAKVNANEIIDYLFLSSAENDVFLVRHSSRGTALQKSELETYLKAGKGFENAIQTNNWRLVSIGDEAYLEQIYLLNNINIGVLVRVNTLCAMLEASYSSENSQYLFLDDGYRAVGTAYAELLSGVEILPEAESQVVQYQNDYVIVSQALPFAGMRLSCVKYAADVYYTEGFLQYPIILLGIVAISLITVNYFYLRKQILKPIKSLIRAAREVEHGNLDWQTTDRVTSGELSTLIDAFNKMTSEIKTLKIRFYEEKIEHQKAELQYLQMQLRPHFFMNAITTISSLSYQNKNEEIRKFIMALSSYLRYLFTDNLSFVSVQDEIEHAIDYIRLQQIKYPGIVFYLSEIAPETGAVLTPKLVIQTFTENIFKHAFDCESMLSIFIRTELVTINGRRMVRIYIEDNGPGFPPKMLEGQGREEGGGIGISNVRKTLALTYHQDDLVRILNCEPNGARIEILIPEQREGGE